MLTIIFIAPFLATRVLAGYPLSPNDRALLAWLPGAVADDGAPDWAAVAGSLTLLVILGAALCAPLVDRLAASRGKRALFKLALWWLGGALLAVSAVGLVPLASPLTQAVLLFALAAFPIAVALVLIRPLLADVIDLDAAQTGQQREGIYVGMFGCVMKLAEAVGPLLASWSMALLGNTVEDSLGVRAAVALAGAALLLAALVFARYPIDK